MLFLNGANFFAQRRLADWPADLLRGRPLSRAQVELQKVKQGNSWRRVAGVRKPVAFWPPDRAQMPRGWPAYGARVPANPQGVGRLCRSSNWATSRRRPVERLSPLSAAAVGAEQPARTYGAFSPCGYQSYLGPLTDGWPVRLARARRANLEQHATKPKSATLRRLPGRPARDSWPPAAPKYHGHRCSARLNLSLCSADARMKSFKSLPFRNVPCPLGSRRETSGVPVKQVMQRHRLWVVHLDH